MPSEPEPLTLDEKRAWLQTGIEATRRQLEQHMACAVEPTRVPLGQLHFRRLAQRDAYHVAILEAELTRIGAAEE